MTLAAHLYISQMTTNFVQFVLSNHSTKTRSTWCDGYWPGMGDLLKIQLVASWRATEASADRCCRQDADELVAECTRTDAVQREIHAVIETVRDSSDVLGGQQTVKQTTCGARGRGWIEIVVEEQRKPNDAVRHVENDEGGRHDQQQHSHVVVAMTTGCSLLAPVMLLLLVMVMVMTMMIQSEIMKMR